MLARLKKLLTDPSAEPVKADSDEKKIATAALLIEAALSDETYCDDERAMVSAVLKRHYDLTDEEVTAVVTEAEDAHGKSDQIWYFTRTVKETVEIEDRVQIIEMLWEIAYADGVISDYEANLVRRICGLIYVDDKDSGSAKKRVMAKLKIG
ncbi:MAG: TerB family tellurite resistance protein [Sneathiella sp.]